MRLTATPQVLQTDSLRVSGGIACVRILIAKTYLDPRSMQDNSLLGLLWRFWAIIFYIFGVQVSIPDGCPLSHWRIPGPQAQQVAPPCRGGGKTLYSTTAG